MISQSKKTNPIKPNFKRGTEQLQNAIFDIYRKKVDFFDFFVNIILSGCL